MDRKESKMSLFFCMERTCWARNWAMKVVCGAMVSMAFVCLFSCGCKKKVKPPAVPAAPVLELVLTNRLNDTAYLGALQKNRDEQMVKARARYEIAQQVKASVERVKATLPKEADEAAVKDALAKDAEWQKLNAQHAQALGEIEKVLVDARQIVRSRLLEETRAGRAVAEGKAKPVDKTDGK